MDKETEQENIDEIESKKLDGLHYYLCSRNFNQNFDETKDAININVEESAEQDAIQKEKLLENKDQNLENNDDQKIQKQLPKVPLTFIDIEDYLTTFEAHLFNEAKAQIIKAKLTESSRPEKVKLIGVNEIKNKKNIDNKEVVEETQQGVFWKFRLQKMEENTNQYSQHDFCIMCQNNPGQGEIVGEHLLGIVEKQEGDHIILKVVYQQKENTRIQQTWYLQKFCKIVTAEREYEALQKLDSFSLLSTLLNPANAVQNYKNSEYFQIPEKLENKLISSYNESQIEAIKQTLKKQGITLIQGPPGTGKTTTVIGTLSVLMNSFNKKVSVEEQKKQYGSKAIVDKKEKFQIDKAMPWTKPGYKNWREQMFDDGEFIEDIETQTTFDFIRPQLYPKEKGIQVQQSNQVKYSPPEKILICGPSNASIDEIIRKLIEKKLLDKNGNVYDPTNIIVRVGENYDNVLQEFSLEFQAKQLMGQKNMKEDQTQEAKKIILNKSKIVCSTLSSAGSFILQQSNLQFDTVIIDEAAQAVECSILIPLQYNCKRLILIGDQKQLPATIFSKTCEKFQYSQSLFERLEKNKYPIHMLKVQYRMHPNISKFISKAFYQDNLKDYEKILDLIGNPPLYSQQAFKPLVFFHVNGAEKFDQNSFLNNQEAQCILDIYNRMKDKVQGMDFKNQLGIITPYARQVKNIRKVIKNHEETEKCEIEVNSVDGYQGREKDIIIFSTVRASKIALNTGDPDKDKIIGNTKQSIGFLNDPRRMNVSLSRARISLIVVGDINQLCHHHRWRTLLQLSVENGSCYKYTPNNYFNKFEADSNQFLIKDFDGYKPPKKKEQKIEQNIEQE